MDKLLSILENGSLHFTYTTVAAAVILTLIISRFFSRRRSVDLDQKYVLITGCDSGFGRETAIRLDKMGACVIATCLTKEGEQSLRSVTSERLKTFQMDVTSSEQIRDVYSEVKKEISTGNNILYFPA